jgi:hypothetical protein
MRANTRSTLLARSFRRARLRRWWIARLQSCAPGRQRPSSHTLTASRRHSRSSCSESSHENLRSRSHDPKSFKTSARLRCGKPLDASCENLDDEERPNKDLIAEVALCRGRLVAWHEWESPRYWDAPSKSRSWVEFRDNGSIRAIQSIEELCSIAHDPSCSLGNDAAQAAVGLALIVALLLGVSRVVTEYGFYDFLEHRYGADVAGNLPRIADSTLSFMTVEMRGQDPPALTKFSLDLRTGEVGRAAVATVPAG